MNEEASCRGIWNLPEGVEGETGAENRGRLAMTTDQCPWNGVLSGGEAGEGEVISKRLLARHPTDTPCARGMGVGR